MVQKTVVIILFAQLIQHDINTKYVSRCRLILEVNNIHLDIGILNMVWYGYSENSFDLLSFSNFFKGHARERGRTLVLFVQRHLVEKFQKVKNCFFCYFKNLRFYKVVSVVSSPTDEGWETIFNAILCKILR